MMHANVMQDNVIAFMIHHCFETAAIVLVV